MIGNVLSRSWLTPEALDPAKSSFIFMRPEGRSKLLHFTLPYLLCSFFFFRSIRFVRPSPNISPVDLLGREISADGKLWADCWDGANGLDAKAPKAVSFYVPS